MKKGGGAVYLVYGADDLSALRKAEEIVQGLCPPEERDFGLEVIDPESGEKVAEAVCRTLMNTIGALLTPSFLGGRKTIYLKNAPYFDPLSEPGKFATVKAAVAQLVEVVQRGLPEGISFVLLTGKVNKTTTFYKTFKAAGEVFAFDEPAKPRDAEMDFIPRVEELLAKKGVEMSPPVLKAFLDRTGFRLRQVEAEVEKLSLYLGERKTATPEDIRLMVAQTRAGEPWDYADAFCDGDLTRTLAVLRQLFETEDSAIPLVVMLQNRLRDLTVLRDCLTRGWARLSGNQAWAKLAWTLPPEGEAVLDALENNPRKMHPFRAAVLAVQSMKQPAARWFRWLQDAVDLQAEMTGGSTMPPETVLELFTLRTLGALSIRR